jgi:hypothetical protein
MGFLFFYNITTFVINKKIEMKNILFIAFLAFYMSAKSQITLEHTYDTASTENLLYNDQDQLMIINFPVEGECYVRVNRVSMTICIYDMTHTLLKAISFSSLPSNVGGSVGDVLYISENLFSTDSKVAFMYLYYNVDTVGGNSLTFYHTDIIEENGTVLFSDTGMAAVRVNYEQQQLPIYNTSVGTKMIISYRNRQAKVFSLPGTLTSSIEEANNNLIAMQTRSSVSNAYPNPNNGSAKIDYTLPPGINEGEIVFYNLQGKEVKRFKVDRTFNTLLISTKDIAAGTYYYQLQTAGDSSGGKKMVVIK